MQEGSVACGIVSGERGNVPNEPDLKMRDGEERGRRGRRELLPGEATPSGGGRRRFGEGLKETGRRKIKTI